ncbi:MAG: hypothetical protein JSW39_23170 [Desulfobacterales bacterium]|nr:MAG: hypothetical protein JSW39_23170 [Desulfobacterales bacterium]
MKIVCPHCRQLCTVAQDALVGPTEKIQCQKCGRRFPVNRCTEGAKTQTPPAESSFKVRKTPRPASTPIPTVSAMGSTSEKDKDYWPAVVLVLALIVLVAAGVYLVKNIDEEFVFRPPQSISELLDDIKRNIERWRWDQRKDQGFLLPTVP